MKLAKHRMIIKQYNPIIIFLLIFLLSFSSNNILSSANAEDTLIEVVERFIISLANCSDKEIWNLKSSDYNKEYCTIKFDLREEWKAIAINDGDGQFRVYFYFTNDEIISSYFHAITIFDEIEKELPNGKKLKLELLLCDQDENNTLKYVITLETIKSYYPWLNSNSPYCANNGLQNDEGKDLK